MAILKNVDLAAGTFDAVTEVDTITSKITDSLTSPFMAATEAMDGPGIFVNDIVWGLGGAIVGGIVARKRADKEPYLGFMF
jgi:hypothetical protein